MLTAIHPKLPMRNKAITTRFYVNKLGFKMVSKVDYEGYLILGKDHVEIHFFEHTTLDPQTNDGQVYIRTNNIEALYANMLEAGINIHPNAPLNTKPWGQKEFALLDPDNNLLTFGQEAESK